MKKSLALVTVLSCAAMASSETLAEAFKNGKTSGDVSAYYESRHVNKGEKSTYFENTAWAVGSVGLGYESDFYKNFKLGIGFRATTPFYEDDKKFDTGNGKGDSTERIYDDNRYMLSKLFIEYNAYDTVIRVGRQEMRGDWITKINDGVSITNNSIANLTIDALWTKARGKVQLNEMFKVKKINENKGMYALGATYKLDMGLAFRAYGMYADDIFSGVGGKVFYDGAINDKTSVGGMLHYAQTSEKQGRDDGKIFEANIYAKYDNVKFTLGYVQTGKKNGWGSFNKAGDRIVQFEEGDVMYERDVKTLYGMLSTSIEKLSVDLIFGSTGYKLKGGDETKYRQHEFSTWLSYPIMDQLSMFATYDQTFKAQPGYPAMTQVSLGLSYKF